MSTTTNYKTVLIAGATGRLGHSVAQAIVDKKHWDVRILVRPDTLKDEKKKASLDSLKQHGAKIVEGDLDKPDTLAEPLNGIDVVVSVVSGGAMLNGQLNLIDAAVKAGVKRFIPSEFGIDVKNVSKGFSVLFDLKIPVREKLEKSGLEYTYIVTGFFLDGTFNQWFGFDAQNGKVAIPGDGNAKFASTTVGDIAKSVPEVILNPKAKNASVYVTGDILTWNHAVELFEKASGKTFEKTFRTVDQLKKAIADNPNPWGTVVEQLLLSIALGYADHPHPSNGDYPQLKFINAQEYVASLYKH